jgi:putative spermidine/putrescine transport system substrate-binding protein
MNKLEKGSCSKWHLNAPAGYFNSIKFWKTPTANCGNGKTNCVDYTKWQSAWTDIKS